MRVTFSLSPQGAVKREKGKTMYATAKRNLIALVMNGTAIGFSLGLMSLLTAMNEQGVQLTGVSTLGGIFYGLVLAIGILLPAQISLFASVVMYSKEKGEFFLD